MSGRIWLCLTLAGLLTGAAVQKLERPVVPEKLEAPNAEDLVLIAHATGVQIYSCKADWEQKYHWELDGPRAELRDDAGALIGKHFAEALGPTWQHNDGSKVSGRKLWAHSLADAVPWLLLTSTGNAGDGVLSRVKTIQRLHTKGGVLAETDVCDEAHSGAKNESTYSADYYFYAPPK